MIVIVDYGMGNLRSIANMLSKVGAEAKVSSDPAEVLRADKLILPGVGAFDAGMEAMEARGLRQALDQRVLAEGAPVLGVCLGMQLLTRRSQEGQLPGLGWVAAETVRFDFSGLPAEARRELKVPHMGWNLARPARPHPLLAGLEDEARFYFVHSYYVKPDDGSLALTLTEHGHDFASALAQGNVMGTQFHPEKSHRFGMRLLANFAALREGGL